MYGGILKDSSIPFDVILLGFQGLDRISINLPCVHAASAKANFRAEINIPSFRYFDLLVFDDLAHSNWNLCILTWSSAVFHNWYIVVKENSIEEACSIISGLNKEKFVLPLESQIPWSYVFPKSLMNMNKVLVHIVAHKALSEQFHVFSEYGTCLISKILAVQSLKYHLWDIQRFVSVWKISIEQCCSSRVTWWSAACKRPDTNIFLIEMSKWCLFFDYSHLFSVSEIEVRRCKDSEIVEVEKWELKVLHVLLLLLSEDLWISVLPLNQSVFEDELIIWPSVFHH